MSDNNRPKKPKSISEMTEQEYVEYLNSVAAEFFMREVVHDIKGQVSLVHGYADIIQLDIAEDQLDPETVDEYMAAIISAVQRIYVCLESAKASYAARHGFHVETKQGDQD